MSAQIINIPDDYPKIQEGIDHADNGDTILVKQGTYQEHINYRLKNIVIASEFIFGHDTNSIHQTVIDGTGFATVVTFEGSQDTTAQLIGFTITNGFEHGISCIVSSPRLLNLIIKNNGDMIYNKNGGGIYCSSSDMILKDSRIQSNQAINGGGICCYTSSPLIINTVIDSNQAKTGYGKGGGIVCFAGNYYSSNPVLIDVKIANNNASYGGGIGFYNTLISENYSSLTILNSILKENKATWVGGGINTSEIYVKLANVKIENNDVGWSGGGIYIESSEFTMENSVITENKAEMDGGGICADTSNLTVINSTIVSNVADSGVNNLQTRNYDINYHGGAIYGQNSSIQLINTICWDNLPEEIYFSKTENTLTVKYSDIKNGEEGIIFEVEGDLNWDAGNINKDPLFTNNNGFIYALPFNSPCVDYGSPDTTGLSLPATDILGNPRIWNNRIDMGAFEWNNVNIPFHNNLSNNLLLKIYPNPVSRTAIIEFELEKPEFCKVEVVDLYSRTRIILYYGKMNSGKQKIFLTPNELPPGIYIIRLWHDNQNRYG